MPTHDIFISYAHIDNEPFGDTKGWVDQLLKNLRTRLAQVLGSEMEIWWDKRLQGDQYFAIEIGKSVSEALLLAPVVTPRYVRSPWCRGELKEFCQGPRIKGLLGNHSGIFKIVKTPVPEEQVPKELRPLLGYIFYELDEKNRPREFRPEIAPNKDQRYWDKLEDLVWDIRDAIEDLRSRSEAVTTAAADVVGALPLEKKVYLAETAPELSVERDRIKRELQQHNYYVLPDQPLPSNPPDLRNAVREYLARCVLSIHMIGAHVDQAVQLQMEIAAERANSGDGFPHIIWLPPGLRIEDAPQQRFVDELQNTIGAGAELLQTPLGDLKLSVIEKLSAAPREEPKADRQRFRVYLIYDNRDAADIKPIDDFLFDHGFEVIPPAFEGGAVELAQHHRESLLNCDAALIYYGNATHMWLRSKIWDLQKARGWGRSSPMRTAVYVGGPETAEKTDFRTLEVPLVIRNFSRFSPDSLQPFLQALQAGNGGKKA